MSAYLVHLINLGGIYILLACSLDIIVGYAGLISLGHAAFFGMGAYTSALLSLNFPQLPFILLIAGSGLFSGAVGLAISPPALKLKDEYLAVVTLGLGIIVQLFLKNLDFTGGPDGLYGITNFRMESSGFLIYIWSVLFLCLLVIRRLSRRQLGLNLTAIRENDFTARTMGISPFPLKALCFSLSAFFAGCAGSLYAHYITFISPGAFGLHTSILLLCMVVLGGMGTLFGPVVGAAALFLLPELLQEISDYQELVYGLLLIITLIFRPQGLLGKTDKGKNNAQTA